MLKNKSAIFRALLFAASILILVVPNILKNDTKPVLDFCLEVISKICMFLFFALILLRLTRSYFWTYLILGIPYLISSVIESFNLLILDNYISADNIASLLNASTGEIHEFYSGFKAYVILPVIIIIAYFIILITYRKIKYETGYQKRLIPMAFAAILISISISVLTIYRTGKL